MSISVYQASIPAFVRNMNNMSTVLDIAVKHAAEKNIDPSIFVNARLAPDMLPLARQIQIATDGVKGFAARVAQVEVPSYEDNETTFDELKARLAKTVAFLETLKEAQFEGAETREVKFTAGKRERTFANGLEYLNFFAAPNYYFHATVAYAILRHNGVPIGKLDYLGGR